MCLGVCMLVNAEMAGFYPVFAWKLSLPAWGASASCFCKLLLQQDMGPVLFRTVASPRPFHLYPQGLPGSDPGQLPVRFPDVFVLDKKRPVLTDLIMVGSSQALSS